MYTSTRNMWTLERCCWRVGFLFQNLSSGKWTFFKFQYNIFGKIQIWILLTWNVYSISTCTKCVLLYKLLSVDMYIYRYWYIYWKKIKEYFFIRMGSKITENNSPMVHLRWNTIYTQKVLMARLLSFSVFLFK